MVYSVDNDNLNLVKFVKFVKFELNLQESLYLNLNLNYLCVAILVPIPISISIPILIPILSHKPIDHRSEEGLSVLGAHGVDGGAHHSAYSTTLQVCFAREDQGQQLRLQRGN